MLICDRRMCSNDYRTVKRGNVQVDQIIIAVRLRRGNLDLVAANTVFRSLNRGSQQVHVVRKAVELFGMLTVLCRLIGCWKPKERVPSRTAEH